jgi:hypothetical protein
VKLWHACLATVVIGWGVGNAAGAEAAAYYMLGALVNYVLIGFVLARGSAQRAARREAK